MYLASKLQIHYFVKPLLTSTIYHFVKVTPWDIDAYLVTLVFMVIKEKITSTSARTSSRLCNIPSNRPRSEAGKHQCIHCLRLGVGYTGNYLHRIKMAILARVHRLWSGRHAPRNAVMFSLNQPKGQIGATSTGAFVNSTFAKLVSYSVYENPVFRRRDEMTLIQKWDLQGTRNAQCRHLIVDPPRPGSPCVVLSSARRATPATYWLWKSSNSKRS